MKFAKTFNSSRLFTRHFQTKVEGRMRKSDSEGYLRYQFFWGAVNLLTSIYVLHHIHCSKIERRVREKELNDRRLKYQADARFKHLEHQALTSKQDDNATTIAALSKLL